MYWINGLYTYCSLNHFLWCSDKLVARGDDADTMKEALTDPDSASLQQWIPCPRKPMMEAQRMRDQYHDLRQDQRRLAFADRRWDMPAQDRYDRPRNEELRRDDE